MARKQQIRVRFGEEDLANLRCIETHLKLLGPTASYRRSVTPSEAIRQAVEIIADQIRAGNGPGHSLVPSKETP